MNPWTGLLAIAAAGSVVELDAAAAGQFMLSRPLVFGPLAGTALGQPALGAELGVLCELLTLEELPVGGNVPLNATAAVAAALLLALGPSPVAPELALPAGLIAGWAHARLESRLRRRRGRLNADVEARLAAGGGSRLGSVAAGELLRQAGLSCAVMLAVLLCRGPLRRAWIGAPNSVVSGLRFALALAPWPALWSLLRSFKVVS